MVKNINEIIYIVEDDGHGEVKKMPLEFYAPHFLRLETETGLALYIHHTYPDKVCREPKEKQVIAKPYLAYFAGGIDPDYALEIGGKVSKSTVLEIGVYKDFSAYVIYEDNDTFEKRIAHHNSNIVQTYFCKLEDGE